MLSPTVWHNSFSVVLHATRKHHFFLASCTLSTLLLLTFYIFVLWTTHRLRACSQMDGLALPLLQAKLFVHLFHCLLHWNIPTTQIYEVTGSRLIGFLCLYIQPRFLLCIVVLLIASWWRLEEVLGWTQSKGLSGLLVKRMIRKVVEGEKFMNKRRKKRWKFSNFFVT